MNSPDSAAQWGPDTMQMMGEGTHFFTVENNQFSVFF